MKMFLASGADPDRCNRCKCIGQFHMIDYLEVCAAEFLLDLNQICVRKETVLGI